ncbi:AI-2E family transporter [Chloroflexota bacterium]
MSAEGSVFKRNRTLIFFLIGLIVAFALIYVLRTPLFPFILGLVVVYLLLPLISWIENRLPGQGKWAQGRRVSVIVLISIIITGLVGVLFFVIIAAVVDSFSLLLGNAPQYFSGALDTIQQWIEGFRQWVPLQFREQIDELIRNSSGAAGKFAQDAIMKGISFIPANTTLIFGFISLPLFIFFLLKDSRNLSSSFYSALSPDISRHTRSIITIIEDVLGKYVRSQLVLSLVVALVCFVGLVILGINPGLALGLAILAGITDAIPVVGPWIGAAAGVIVALAVIPDKIIWVIVVYVASQAIENFALRPKIQASYMHIHPAIVLVLLVLGSYVAGVWGLILSVPLAATVVGIFKYVHHNLNNVEAVENGKPAEQ